MSEGHMEEYAEKLKIAQGFANRVVRIENDTKRVISLVFEGFHNLGFKRVRIYRYRDGRCFSWRCCGGHTPQIRDLFDKGQIVLSPRESEPDNFASMRGEKVPLIVVYDPKCDKPGPKEDADNNNRHVFMTSTDPWYEKLGKPEIREGETFEWLDCPLLAGNRIWGKISMDCHKIGFCFTDTDLDFVTPLSFLVASALERNPLYEYDVFLSFDSSRQEFARTAAYILEDAGLRTFIAPDTIPPGYEFQQVIREGILGARNILVLFSPECIGNDWVYAECSSSWLLGKDITVFRVGNVRSADLPFFMKHTQSPLYTIQNLIRYAKKQVDRKQTAEWSVFPDL